MWIKDENRILYNGEHIWKIDAIPYVTNMSGDVNVHEFVAYRNDDMLILARVHATIPEAYAVLDEIAREIKHGKELIDIPEIIRAITGITEEDFG